MRAFIFFAVLLAVMQASPPVPGQATDSGAQKRSETQGKANSQQKKSNPASGAANAKGSESNQQNGTKNASSDAHVPVSVIKLPTVSVQPDWRDTAMVVLTGALVLVGTVGVVTALCTLWQLKRQIDAVFLVERGWLNLDPPPTPTLEDDILGLSLTLALTNIGRSPVWIVSSGLRCFLSDDKEIREPLDYSACKPFLEAGALIGAGKSTPPYTDVADRDMNIQLFSADRAKKQQSFFHFYGRVVYRDTTGNTKRRMFFCYRLDIWAKIEQGDFKDAWVKEGPERANWST
jgi:hypothetical protein